MPPWPTEAARDDPGTDAHDQAGNSPAGERARGGDALIGGSLMAACVGLHIWAMFPPYTGGPTASSVVSSPDQTAVYICLEVGWAVAALLVLSRASVRGGAALGAGLGTVELGLLITDTALGLQVANGSAPGVWLALGGLGAGLAGVLFAASSVTMVRANHLRSLSLSTNVGLRAVLTVLVAVVAVAAFWPNWAHYHLVSTTGRTLDFYAGDAFKESAPIIAGALVSGLAIGIISILSAFWSPLDAGAWALAGAVVGLASQLISQLVQVFEPLSDTIGSTSGLNVNASSLSVTPWWAIDLLAAMALAGLALWAGLESRRTEASGSPVAVSDPLHASYVPLAEDQWPAGHRWPGA
jgi:hypothetical protein